jgi:hypothetical protein
VRCLGYQQYGISKDLVERVKKQMKNKEIKEKVKLLTEDVTKADLQNRSKIKSLLNQGSKIVGIPVPRDQADKIVDFVISLKIDPNNTFHLIKLWGMFR